MTVANPQKKTLTDNQRRILSDLLRKQDKVFISLMSKTKSAEESFPVSDKLSTNLDFQKKLMASFDRLKKACMDEGVYLPVFEEAEKQAGYHVRAIVAGQPRWHVRENINSARCSFFYALLIDSRNVVFDFVPFPTLE